MGMAFHELFVGFELLEILPLRSTIFACFSFSREGLAKAHSSQFFIIKVTHSQFFAIATQIISEHTKLVDIVFLKKEFTYKPEILLFFLMELLVVSMDLSAKVTAISLILNL